MKLFAAMQNSLPSGSCMTVQRWRPPPIWCSPTIDAPKATNRSIAEGSGSTKSRCMRFLATLSSGTFSKYQAGSVRSGSSLPSEANPGPLPGSSGRCSASDQKRPILRIGAGIAAGLMSTHDVIARFQNDTHLRQEKEQQAWRARGPIDGVGADQAPRRDGPPRRLHAPIVQARPEHSAPAPAMLGTTNE